MPDNVYETKNEEIGQWRRFLGTGKWVILPAPQRQKKPAAYLIREKQDFDERKFCPFCPDNLKEGLFKKINPEEPKGALVKDATTGGTDWLSEEDQKLPTAVKKKKWKACTIKNVNPVLNGMTDAPPAATRDHPFIFADGLGICDVIIDSQIHSKPLGVLDREVCENVINTYFNRSNDLHTRYPSIECISIFHNHRIEAGATIPHSHSQLFATPFVPAHIESEIRHAKEYYENNAPNHCPFCDMIANERDINERVIKENGSFIAITPFASGCPFEIWILPREHNPSFGRLNQLPPETGINEQGFGELADILTWVLGRLYICVDDPGYNFVICTLPLHPAGRELRYWHWHIRIETQRLDVPAGYEMASQVRVNKLPPENAAKFLKNMGNLFKEEVGNIFQRKPEDIENILSIIKRERDEGLELNEGQIDILKTAAKAFKFSEYYRGRKNQKLMDEEETILNRATSWVTV